MRAGLLDAQKLSETPAPITTFPKWRLFRKLCATRALFDVIDRAFAVLNAFSTFLRSDDPEDGKNPIMFPSNAVLSDRAYGMADSTLRRHVAKPTWARDIAKIIVYGPGVILPHNWSECEKRSKERPAGPCAAIPFSRRPKRIMLTAVNSDLHRTEDRSPDRTADPIMTE
ncbi:MAG: helix-turn-helix domain-containing protein [Pseudomonadota bacterium]